MLQKGASPIASGTTNTLIRRFFDEVVTRGDMAAAHDILTADFVCYGPATAVHGPINFVHYTGVLRNALAVQFTVEEMIADGDMASCLSTMHGIHQGEYQGSPASGRQIALSRIDTFQLAEGRIREVRTTFDHQLLMQQIEP